MGKKVTRIEDEISNEAYEFIYNNSGSEEADRWFQKVHNGEVTKEYVDNMIRRPDIVPEKWQDFEEGWRPEGW